MGLHAASAIPGSGETWHRPAVRRNGSDAAAKALR
jgi:hypothetical protein